MSVKALKMALDILKNVDEKIHVTTAQIFLSVGENEAKGNEPHLVTDFIDIHHLSLASASRHVALLSHTRRQGTEGMGLVEVTVNPEERRQRLITLTPKGKRVYQSIVNIMES